MDHFEECHVVVLGRDGRTLYPSPVADSESDAALFEACTSIVLSYPQSDPPVLPPSLESLLDPGFQLAQAARTYRDIVDADADLDSASYSSASTLPSPSPSEPICLPPSLLTISPAHTYTPTARSAPEGMLPHERGTNVGPKNKHKRAPKNSLRVQPWNTSMTARTERRTDVRYAPTKKRERVKAYKCPVSRRRLSYSLALTRVCSTRAV